MKYLDKYYLSKYQLFKEEHMKAFLKICLLLLFCLLIQPLVLFAQEEEPEEEEPIQAYPNPLENEMSDAKAMQIMKTQLSDMGFTVGKVRKVANGRFVVTVQGWEQVKMKPRYRGSVNILNANKTGKMGSGEIIVTVNKNGIFFDNASFRKMGMQLDAAKLNQAAKVR